MDTKYKRVIPRDLFNEAKLLKCMGRLVLLIQDRFIPLQMSCVDNGEPFKIALMDEGSLTITNITITVKGRTLLFKTTYNAKSNYPLYVEHDNCDYRVFDETGEFDMEFINFCRDII